MKAINRRYHNLDKPTVASSVTWDMSDGHTIVVNDLSTEGNMGDGKEELTALAQQACDSYEENL